MDIWNVVAVPPNQFIPKRPLANPVFKAIVDINGKETYVYLKDLTRRQLAKEIIAIVLGELLRVPHATGAIASLDMALAKTLRLRSDIPDPTDYDRRLAFASMPINGLPMSEGGDTDLLGKARYFLKFEACQILIFDQFLANSDRKYDDLRLVVTRKLESDYFVAFDHDEILFGSQTEFSTLPDRVADFCTSKVSDDVAFYTPQVKDIIQRMARSFSDKVENRLQFLSELSKFGLISHDDARAVEFFLTNRLRSLPDLVLRHYSSTLSPSR